MKDLTKIVFIIDRSGSMQSVKDDAIGGMNAFIEEQKQQEGEATLSVYQFDDEYETLFENKSIQDAPQLDLRPRNMTALYDAIGKTINNVGSELAALEEAERPDKVLFVIITDGAENASQEFNSSQVKEMIAHQKEKYSWNFIFICSDVSQIDDAYNNLGFTANSVMNMGKSGKSMNKAFANVSSYTSRARSMSTMDYMATISSDEILTDEEKDANED